MTNRNTVRGRIQKSQGQARHGVRTLPAVFDWFPVRGLLQDLIDSHHESVWLFSLFGGFSADQQKSLLRSFKFLSKDNNSLEKLLKKLRFDVDSLDLGDKNRAPALEGIVGSDGAMPLVVEGVASSKNATGDYTLVFDESVPATSVVLVSVSIPADDPYRISWRWVDDKNLKVFIAGKVVDPADATIFTDELLDADFCFYVKRYE